MAKDGKKHAQVQEESSGLVTHVALEERIGKLELAYMEEQEKLNAFKAIQQDTTESFEELKGDMRGTIEVIKSQMVELALHCDRRIADLRALHMEEVEALKTKVAVLERTMTNGEPTHREFTKVKVPEPRSFKVTRDAKELENFLWQMEQYFKAAKVEEEEAKLHTVVMYLINDTMLWWRRCYGDIELGFCTITTWEEFKRELKAQFLTENVEYLAKKSLKRLKHVGSIREYVKQFTTLLLDISDMSEKDKFFSFMDSLQPWAEQELQRRGVQDLASPEDVYHKI